MALLDLDELPHLRGLGPLWGHEARAPVSFRRADHFGDPAVPLGQAVRDLIERRTGTRPAGPIRLLTHPRTFGYVFNPVSLYFCYGDGGEQLECVVAEVTNTPWLERHCYVLPVAPDRRASRRQRFSTPKEFHVSPFMDMSLRYEWSLTLPGDDLKVHIGSKQDGALIFGASMSLRRTPLDRASLARALVVYPFMTARLTAAIYFQAFRLWAKGAPYFPHPRYRADAAVALRPHLLPSQARSDGGSSPSPAPRCSGTAVAANGGIGHLVASGSKG